MFFKHLLILVLSILIFSSNSLAQILLTDDNNSTTPDTSALLELESTSKGLLFPRMTTSDQRLIPNPTQGLVIFNTDSADFYGFDGTYWKALWDYPTDTITVFSCPDSIEYSGQWYTTVRIGNQCWFAENLNVGDRIDGSQDQTDNSTIEKYCYNNDEDSCDIYGGLYQWNEMMQYTTQNSAQGICPAGWHIPNDEEWKVLEGNTDSQYSVGDPEWDGTAWRGYDAGKRLKSVTSWIQNSGTDAFSFNALPGGFASGTFSELGEYCYWWSSTEDGGTRAWRRILQDIADGVARQNLIKDYGISVRCIKD